MTEERRSDRVARRTKLPLPTPGQRVRTPTGMPMGGVGATVEETLTVALVDPLPEEASGALLARTRVDLGFDLWMYVAALVPARDDAYERSHTDPARFWSEIAADPVEGFRWLAAIAPDATFSSVGLPKGCASPRRRSGGRPPSTFTPLMAGSVRGPNPRCTSSRQGQ